MNYNKQTVKDVPLSGKKVLLRCDFNVPQDKTTGEITSESALWPHCRRSATCSITAPL